MGFWDTFSDFKRPTRVVMILSLILGVAALITGLTVDHTKPRWSDGLNYLPNAWASLTGFLIGLPFALVVLATFTVQREEKATLDRVNRLTAIAWDAFRALVDDFASDERYNLVVNQARDIKQHYDETAAAIDAYMGLANQVLGTPDVIALDRDHARLKELEPKFRTAVNSLRQDINFFGIHDEWAQLAGGWRILDQYVRLQRLEQGLEWFGKAPDAGLRRWASQESNPLQQLLDAIEVRFYTPNLTLNVETMADALDTLAFYARFDDAAHLGEYLLNQGNMFTPDRSRTYHAKRDAAQLFILDLKRYVGLVQVADWPRGCTVPNREGIEREPTNYEWLGSLNTPLGIKRLEKALKQYRLRRTRELRRQRIKRMLRRVNTSPS